MRNNSKSIKHIAEIAWVLNNGRTVAIAHLDKKQADGVISNLKIYFDVDVNIVSQSNELTTIRRSVRNIEKSELNCRDRYEVAENIYTEPISKKRLLNLAIIFIAMMVIGIPLILYLSELIFGF